MQTTVDPEWAWSSFDPNDGEWDIRAAAHLYRRAGFGVSRAELQRAVAAGPAVCVEQLFSNVSEPPEFVAQMDTLAKSGLATGNTQQLSAWWTYRMLTTEAQLQEKLTLFWHGHFATGAEKVEDAELMYKQNQLLRKFSLGSFAELALEISRDPAMLIYLDSATNRKAHPNENFAREIMELFCLGEGNYQEEDIRELARCFTGWEVKGKKFRFNRYQHDKGSKTVLGQTGNFGGEEAVGIVVNQHAAPQFIVSRLLRFLVMDEPTPTLELLAPLVKQLKAERMNVGPVVRRILSSNLFYSQQAVARKVKSPVELAVGFLRSLDGSTDTFQLANQMQQLGQGLFFPPSVKGWDGGRTWINSSTLLGRSNLIRQLLESEKTRFGKETLARYLSVNHVRTADQLIDFFEELLFAVPIPTAARDRIKLLAGDLKNDRQIVEAVHAICTLPEYQLA